jgi:hypothetical protein
MITEVTTFSPWTRSGGQAIRDVVVADDDAKIVHGGPGSRPPAA